MKDFQTLQIQAPQILEAEGSSSPWRLVSWDKERKSLAYKNDNHKNLISIPIFLLEKHFPRKSRPEPSSKIIKQGRWECGPATLAMMLGESLWDVKRAMVKVGWNNDDGGCTDTQLINAASLLGHEVYRTLDSGNFPQILSTPSLNVKRMNHVVYWNGTELLDPNWGYKGRTFWGCEWGPEVIKTRSIALVKAETGCSVFTLENKGRIRKLQKDIASILNAASKEEKTPA